MPPLHIGSQLAPWRCKVAIEAVRAWCEVLHDPNPIHLDGGAVRRLGLGDRPINPGPANLAYMLNMLATNFPTARIADLAVRMRGPVFVGDLVEVSGRITDVGLREGTRYARCALELHAGSARSAAATGSADLVLEHALHAP
jgi:acyl dehydratase